MFWMVPQSTKIYSRRWVFHLNTQPCFMSPSLLATRSSRPTSWLAKSQFSRHAVCANLLPTLELVSSSLSNLCFYQDVEMQFLPGRYLEVGKSKRGCRTSLSVPYWNLNQTVYWLLLTMSCQCPTCSQVCSCVRVLPNMSSISKSQLTANLTSVLQSAVQPSCASNRFSPSSQS